jgi:hypothetical protein
MSVSQKARDSVHRFGVSVIVLSTFTQGREALGP